MSFEIKKIVSKIRLNVLLVCFFLLTILISNLLTYTKNLIILVIYLPILFYIVYFFSNYITLPITRLNTLLKEKNLEKVNFYQYLEIKEISNSINSFSKYLKKKNKEMNYSKNMLQVKLLKQAKVIEKEKLQTEIFVSSCANRELKMIELKKKIKLLEAKLEEVTSK